MYYYVVFNLIEIVLDVIVTFQEASIIYDKFHVIQVVDKAMDDLRKAETQQTAGLKKSKFYFPKNTTNLITIQNIQR